MHLVTAVIKPFTAELTVDALKAVGVGGVTVTEVRGFGRQGGHTETYRGVEYTVDLVPKVRLDVLVGDGDLEFVVDTITSAARTGEIGDGKVWVTPVTRAVRIRTGERDDDAL